MNCNVFYVINCHYIHTQSVGCLFRRGSYIALVRFGGKRMDFFSFFILLCFFITLKMHLAVVVHLIRLKRKYGQKCVYQKIWSWRRWWRWWRRWATYTENWYSQNDEEKRENNARVRCEFFKMCLSHLNSLRLYFIDTYGYISLLHSNFWAMNVFDRMKKK